MGTDATALVEIRLDDRWVPAIIPIWINSLYNPEAANPILRDRLTAVPIMERNYALFSVLADVRNRTGRGTQTPQHVIIPDTGERVDFIYDTDDGGHDPLIPIDMPRGVPEGASVPWLELAENTDVFHDLTWFTLAELTAGPWDQRVYAQGVVTEEQYAAYQHEGLAPTWDARSSGGPGSLTVTEVEYAAGVRGEHTTSIDLRYSPGTVRDGVPWFFSHLDMMRMLAPDNDPTLIRMLIAFDS